MNSLAIEVVEWVSDSQPGFVRAVLRDAHGNEWWITEKVPVISRDDLSNDSDFPVAASIACRVIDRSRSKTGDGIATISIDPWGIESECGRNEFEVLVSQLANNDRSSL